MDRGGRREQADARKQMVELGRKAKAIRIEVRSRGERNLREAPQGMARGRCETESSGSAGWHKHCCLLSSRHFVRKERQQETHTYLNDEAEAQRINQERT